MANNGIGVKGWRNYSTFSLFSSGSQRADRNSSLLIDTYSGDFTILATDELGCPDSLLSYPRIQPSGRDNWGRPALRSQLVLAV